MRTLPLIAAWALGAALLARPAGAQGLTTETDLSLGYSTPGSAAVGMQVRVFGDVRPGLRLYLEGVWARQWDGPSDAFGGAYPYNNRIRPHEAYLEWSGSGAGWHYGARGGRFRVPFGIYDRSAYAYNGFTRAPLIRYPGYAGLSNWWLDAGAVVFAGTPRLQIEASVGTPSDESPGRVGGVDRSARLQGVFGDLIVGGSHLRTQRESALTFATGDSEWYGVDARWMKGGIQLSGEWLTGVPFTNGETTGWHLDFSIHQPWMDRVTVVARYDNLSYINTSYSVFDFRSERWTLGARVRITNTLTAQINAIHQPKRLSGRESELDAGLTYSRRW